MGAMQRQGTDSRTHDPLLVVTEAMHVRRAVRLRLRDELDAAKQPRFIEGRPRAFKKGADGRSRIVMAVVGGEVSEPVEMVVPLDRITFAEWI